MTSVPPSPTIGIDFGTTNTVVSMTHGDGPATLVTFPTPAATSSPSARP
jgi:hypothetical chaperone protein